MNNEA